jgi:hypothetical protein
VQATVTTTLLGEDPQLGKADGLTVNETVSGWLEDACNVTGETVGLHVKESVADPEPDCEVNVIVRGFVAQETLGGLLSALAK